MALSGVKTPKKRFSPLLTTCYICKRTYKSPKVLSCYHTFCESCLQESVPAEGLSLHCNICGHQSILPKEGVSELRSNPFIDKIMLSLAGSARTVEDQGSDVTDVSELHANLATEESLSSPGIFVKDEAIQNTMQCSPQCEEAVSMYCRSCDMVVCQKCAMIEHMEHHDLVTTLENVSSDCEEVLLKQADILEQKLTPLQKALDQIAQLFDELESRKDLSVHLINDSFDTLQRIANQRKEALLKNVDAIYELKRSNLAHQVKEIRKYTDRMEEGFDVIVQSLSSKIANTRDEEFKQENSDGASRTKKRFIDTRAFFLHKQVSKTVDDLCKYKLGSEESLLKNDDSTSTLSEHSVFLTGDHGGQTYQAPIKLTVPSENSHISLANMQNLNKINHMISNIGTVETSHAIPEKSVISGECITTGYCKAGCENRIILTAKTWSGELETSGKVLATVNAEYVGPNDDKDVVVYRRRASNLRPNSSNYRRTWDGSKTPQHLFGSGSILSTPPKQGSKKPKPVASSPSGGRSPLKDMFFRVGQGPNTSSPTTPSQEDEQADATDASVRIDYIKNGAYEITFVPRVPGKYKLSASLYGREFPHSSFSVSAIDIKHETNCRLKTLSKGDTRVAMRPQSVRQKGIKRHPSATPRKNPVEDDLLQTVGTRGRGKGEFSNPQDVSTDHLGRLIVADSTNQSIQVFSLGTRKTKEPKYLFRFGERGSGNGQVQRPTGVCGLSNGDFAASDYDNKVVKIFGEDGVYKSGIGAGKLMGPKGVCLDRNGHLVVVDNKLCQIHVFQLNGRLVTKFGTRGTEPHQLAGPHFVAVNSDDLFYISDFYNHCVKIFTPRGNYVSCIGSKGEGCGQFNAPTGLAIDARGNLIVADWGNSRIQVFDKHGSFLTYINANEDPLYGPQGVTVIRDEQVAVADSGNQRVKIYRYLQ